MTSPVPSPPASTTSTSTTPFVSFNPAGSLFSAGTMGKTLGPLSNGPLTPKSHEQQTNVMRNIPPHRSRFFHAETPRLTIGMKPWFEEDKENYAVKGADAKVIRGCLRCFDKASFVLDPCSHL